MLEPFIPLNFLEKQITSLMREMDRVKDFQSNERLFAFSMLSLIRSADGTTTANFSDYTIMVDMLTDITIFI
jgi:hypothetical protein